MIHEGHILGSSPTRVLNDGNSDPNTGPANHATEQRPSEGEGTLKQSWVLKNRP